MRSPLAVLSLLLATLGTGALGTGAQTAPAPAGQEAVPEGTPTLTTTATLVRVPVMVTTKAGEPVFTLKAADFHVTDDAVPLPVTLDDETGSQPLALVVVFETGGEGGRHLEAARKLPIFLDSIVGGVPHRVGVIAFDSEPTVVQRPTEDDQAVGRALNELESGDQHAAILDALKLAVTLLRTQPLSYRRAILLVSETVDHGSHAGLGETLRVIGDTNTTIYSVTFNSSRAAARHETERLLGGSNAAPGPAHGCFSKGTEEEDLASDTSDNRFVQAYDCLSLLAPPLRLIKIATLVAMDNLRKNVPESVARQTGGEYVKFSDTHSLERGLTSISNHLPNQYVLSFHPLAPHPGLHQIGLEMPEYPQLRITARTSYWAESAAPPSAPP